MMTDGDAPRIAARSTGAADVRSWIDDCPEQTMRGLGVADVSIIDEFDRRCAVKARRVAEIWALDRHLVGYRREP